MSANDLDFQTIYEIFQSQIYRHVTRIVGAQDAEDVTQEVFAKVNRELSRFRGESQLFTWIYRIATNAAWDWLRSPSFQRTVLIEAGAPDKAPSVEEHLVRMETNQCIRYFVDCLPVNYRTVLVLIELEGLKNREVAEIFGVSLGSVKINLHRAKAKLKKELDTHCTIYSDERNELTCNLKKAFNEAPQQV